MSKEILCSICTRNRYETTLPMTIQSVLMQTRKPDKLVIFDDSDPSRDMREVPVYQYLFQMLQLKNIAWEWIYAKKMGQHYSHQWANTMGYEWVWRLDDDTVAEPNVLDVLYNNTNKYVGAVGGSVLTPPIQHHNVPITGRIENIDREPNIQWDIINNAKDVDHLHCSFLYRAGIVDYDLSLSRVAHREETLFTYGLKKAGYKILVVPNALVWHLRNQTGGIRDGQKEMFDHDEKIFRGILGLGDATPVVLDCGIGDHIVFKHVLPDIKNPIVYSCFPEVVPGRSIGEAMAQFGDINRFNIYQKMDEWNWKGSLEDAFRKLYKVERK